MANQSGGVLEQTPLHVTALDAAGLLLIEWDDARAMHAAMIDALQPFMYLLESHDGCKRLFEAIDKLVPNDEHDGAADARRCFGSGRSFSPSSPSATTHGAATAAAVI